MSVEPHGRATAYLTNAKRIPFSQRIISQHERIFSGPARGIVPEPSTAQVSSQAEFVGIGVVPDLHLRRLFEIDPAVRFGNRFVIDQQFEVFVVGVGRQVHTFPVIDEVSVFDRPVFASVRGPFGLLLLQLFVRCIFEFHRSVRPPAMPPVKIFPIEDGCESFRRIVGP